MREAHPDRGEANRLAWLCDNGSGRSESGRDVCRAYLSIAESLLVRLMFAQSMFRFFGRSKLL